MGMIMRMVMRMVVRMFVIMAVIMAVSLMLVKTQLMIVVPVKVRMGHGSMMVQVAVFLIFFVWFMIGDMVVIATSACSAHNDYF